MRIGGKVGSGFFQRVTAGAENDFGKSPEAEKAGTGAVGGGEEDVGVEKEPVHEVVLLRTTVGDGIWVEAKLFDFAASTVVVGAACGIGEQEFGLTLWSVFLDRDEHGGAKQDAFVARLGGDVGAFFEAKAAAKFSGDDDGATLADTGGIQGRSPFRVSEDQYIRYSERWKPRRSVARDP